MPERWRKAFEEMLPRLEAERNLHAYNAAALPHLYGRRGHRERLRMLHQWERQAAGRGRARGPVVLKTGAELRAWLAATGGIDAGERSAT